MKDEKYPSDEEYYCKKCKMIFVPAYYPVLCSCCGGNKVVSVKSLRVSDRDCNTDPSYLDYILKNKGKEDDDIEVDLENKSNTENDPD